MATPKKTPARAAGEKKTDDAAPKSAKIANGAPRGPEITHEMIAKRAFEIWCEKGCPIGGEAENWLRAQDELSAELGLAASSRTRGDRADARS